MLEIRLHPDLSSERLLLLRPELFLLAPRQLLLLVDRLLGLFQFACLVQPLLGHHVSVFLVDEDLLAVLGTELLQLLFCCDVGGHQDVVALVERLEQREQC